MAQDYSHLLPMIKACVDIGDYDSKTTDINQLTLNVLYTHENFRIISSLSPGGSQSAPLKSCSSDYIDQVIYTAFRLTPNKPSAGELSTLGYSYNSGYYYYYGGYDKYYATDVQEIVKVVPLDDGGLFVIFTNYYLDGERAPVYEYSSMRFNKDNQGYYVTAIDMDIDFSQLSEHMGDRQENALTTILGSIRSYLPVLILIVTVGTVIFILFRFVLF